MYITWVILNSVAHELYHHKVRGQNKLRKPKFEKEQRDADKWAHKTILPAFSKVFPKSKFEREWKEIMHQFYESEISNKTVNQSGNKFGVDR